MSLKQIDHETLAEKIRLHGMWLRGESGGAPLNLSDADLSGRYLRESDLRESDLRESDLSGCDLIGANLSGANLSGVDLRGVDLRWADLSGANLLEANLSGANLSGANLSGANLSGANLLEAIGLPTDCALPGIDAAVLAHIQGENAQGKLEMSAWHTCETTHCRAGWAVTLAPGGRDLERRLGTNAAAAIIYAASGEPKIPNWHTSNEEAIVDMRERAAKQVAP